MNIGVLLATILISATNLTITEPVDGETYDGDWLPLRAIVENENELPDSVHYSLNGETAALIPRLNTDWFTYMANNNNTGYSESPAPLDNTVLWTAPVTGNLHEFPTPVIVNGIVYYPQDCSGDSLYALNAATGELIWKYRAGGCDDAVTVVDGLLYSSADSLYCLNALTGERIWASRDGGWGNTPVVSDGRVYSDRWCGYGSGIFCHDSYTGTEIWSDTLSSVTWSCMVVWKGIVFIPTVIVTGQGTSLYALDANTGSILWENSDAFGGYWDSSPTVADSTIYISGCDGRTRAIDAMTGLTIWMAPTKAQIVDRTL